jgi:hypothetical protein
MMVLVLGVALLGTSANAEAESPLVVQVPFSRSDLVTGHPFQAQGDRFAVSWRDGDRFQCGVVDVIDGSMRTIDVYPAAKRPAVVGEPPVVYAAFGDVVEGPLIHRIYDFAGNELHEKLKTTWLRPTPSGRYLVASSDLLLPLSFGIFDAQLKPLDQPSDPLVDSRSWDAIPISDTMCVVRNGRTVMQVSLPDQRVLNQRDVTMDVGHGMWGLYCNASGSVCAVTNYSGVAVIDMNGGDSFQFREELFSTLVISGAGEPVYALLDRGDGLLRITRHDRDALPGVESIEVDLRNHEPALLRTNLDTAYFTGSQLLVNYTLFNSHTGQNPCELGSVHIGLPLSHDTEPVFVDGPSWLADPSASRAYSLEFLGENRLAVSWLAIEERKE